MSIKSKLSISISIIVSTALVLNIIFSYISNLQSEQVDLENHIKNIAEQLSISVELIHEMNEKMEMELAKSLKSAAIIAEQKLPPNVEHITNEQLVSLKKEIGLEDITLWIRKNEELVSVRSSNPNEINLQSKTWDYWNVAMNEVMDLKPVTVKKGEKLEHFYSGPLNFAVSDPSKINKWGYYYSGKTNYMINTMIRNNDAYQNGSLSNIQKLIDEMVSHYPSLLEITGFNPQFFGEERILKMKKGVLVHNLDVRDIPFGTYRYKYLEQDVKAVQQANNSQTVSTQYFKSGNKKLARAYIPLSGEKRYVVGAVIDRSFILKEMNKKLVDQLSITAILVLITLISSYFISGLLIAPLKNIMRKVNDIANNNFNTELIHQSTDELGVLAKQVNVMGSNLYQYTDRLQRTAAELRSTKQYLESFFNHTTDAIHIIELNENVKQVNKAFELMFGWNGEEIIGKPLHIFAEEEKDRYRDLLMAVANGEGITGHETIMLNKEGMPIDVSVTVSPILDEENNIIAFAYITRNITSKKQTEELIRKNEKLAAIEQLAASIAHEIRNPLTTVRGFLQLNKNSGILPQRHMDLVMREIEHMNLTVSQFLLMSKPQMTTTEEVHLLDTIEDVLTLMTSAGILENVKVEINSVDLQLPVIQGVESHLKQVFVNLFKNCVEAMPDGGTIHVNVTHDSKQITVQVTDTGIGISEESLEKLGDPFMTNKVEGNGLGVMVSQRIIQNHNGQLTYSSKPGLGTTAIIVLPL